MGISALLASQILDASATGRSVITGADASAIRTTLGLGTLSTQSPTGTPSASTFLRGDFSWQTIDLSGYLQLTGGTMTGALAITQATANTSVLTSTGYSLTGSNAQSLIDVSGTWNTTGTPTLIKANVTNTASNANSLLMDLQTGGTSRFRVTKDGLLRFTVAGLYDHVISVPNGYIRNDGAFTSIQFALESAPQGFWNSGELRLGVTTTLGWASANGAISNAADLVLLRDAAQTLAQRNGLNPQVHRIYNTFTDSSNYERAKIAWESNVLRIGTEKAGTGSARALELQTDGTTRLTIGSAGNCTNVGTFTNQYGATVNDAVSISSVGTLFGGTNSEGVKFQLVCAANADSLRLASTSFIGFNSVGNLNSGSIDTQLRRNAAGQLDVRGDSGLRVRNLANSADADITAKAATFSGNVTVSAVNLVTDTTTGTKIGTATSQKLGFYNATPVVQPTAVADATDAASVITQLNALLSRMRDLGLIAT